jgi:hypothetical protein
MTFQKKAGTTLREVTQDLADKNCAPCRSAPPATDGIG